MANCHPHTWRNRQATPRGHSFPEQIFLSGNHGQLRNCQKKPERKIPNLQRKRYENFLLFNWPVFIYKYTTRPELWHSLALFFPQNCCISIFSPPPNPLGATLKSQLVLPFYIGMHAMVLWDTAQPQPQMWSMVAHALFSLLFTASFSSVAHTTDSGKVVFTKPDLCFQLRITIVLCLDSPEAVRRKRLGIARLTLWLSTLLRITSVVQYLKILCPVYEIPAGGG